MVQDNIIYATTQTKNVVTSLKKKLSNVRVSLENLTTELEKLEAKVENVVTQSDIYKAKVEREMGREVRRLERELALLRKNGVSPEPQVEVSGADLQVASTIGIFDSILRQMCADAEDFRLASEAFLFPAVYERAMEGNEEAYFLDKIPNSANLVIQRGKEHISWIREEYDTHITDPETWDLAIDYVVEWWRNDALPLIYGARDDQWDIDVPLSLQEILLWRESPADRPLNFSKVFDAYEIYRKHRDQVYESSGIRDFELKLFTFEAEKAS